MRTKLSHVLPQWLSLAWLLVLSLVQIAAAQTQLPTSIAGHSAAVNSAVYTHNGRYVVTGGADQIVKIWDAKSGELVRELAGHTGQVMNVAVSPDDSVIVSAASDNTLRMWDIPRPEPLRSFPGVKSPISDVAISATGDWAVSVGEDRAARVWRLEDAAVLQTLEGHEAKTVVAAVRGDSNQLATGDALGEIVLWNPQGGLQQGRLGAHSGAVTGMAFHPNNQQLVTTGTDGQLKVWQLPLPALRPLAGTNMPVRAVTVSTDGQLTLAGGDSGVWGYTTSNGALAREFPNAVGTTTTVAISPNNAIAAAAGEAGVIKFWNLGDAADRFGITGHDGVIYSIAFHPDNARIASAGDDGTIRLWRMPTPPTPLAGHTGDVAEMAFSANGQMAISVSADKTVRAWNPTNGQAIWQQVAGESPLTKLAIRADSTQLAHGGADGVIQLRNAADGALQQTLGAHAGAVRGVAYLPAGNSLATIGEDNCLKIWNLPAPPALALAGNAESVNAVELSKDGKLILTAGGDKSIRVYDAESGQQTRLFAEVLEAVTALALNSDDTLTAAGHANGTIKLFSTADGTPWKGIINAEAPADATAVPPAAELFGHDGAIAEVAFRADAQQIVSAGADGTIRVWTYPQSPQVVPSISGNTSAFVISPDGKLAAVAGMHQERFAVFLLDVATGTTVQTLLGHEATIGAVVFSNDGKLLATGSADKTARLWNLADPKFPEVQKFVHETPVSAVAISPDGTQLYSACGDNVIRCWNVADGSEARAISGHGGAVVRMTVRGTTLFSASADGTVRMWNTADGAAIRSINHGAAVTCLSVDATGKLVASGGADNNVKLWNAVDGAAIATLGGYVAALVDVQFNGDASRLASASHAGLWLWDVAGQRRLESFVLPDGEKRGVGFWGSQLATMAADGTMRIQPSHLSKLIDAHAEGVVALALTPDGQQAATTGADKTVKLWNLAEGTLVATFGGATDVTQAVVVTPDGKHLLAGGLDKTLRAWPIPVEPAPQPVAALKAWELPAAITSLHIGGAGRRVAIGCDDQIVRVWDWTIERELERFTGHTAAILDVQLSADGTTVISGSADKTARKSPLALAHVAVLEHPPHDVAFTPDGVQLVVAVEQPALMLWQITEEGLAANGTLPAVDAKPEGFVANPQMALALRGDGKQIAALDAAGRTHVWKTSDQSLAFTVAAAEAIAPPPAAPAEGADAAQLPPGQVQFSADGGKLLIGNRHQLRIVDTITGRLLQQFDEPNAIASAAIAPDNLTLAVGRVGAADNAALRQFSLERLIEAHDGAVASLAFTVDGAGLISGGVDKAVHLWNTADGSRVRSYVGSEDAITSVAVTRDGQRVLAGGIDKKVRLWPIAAAPTEGQTAEQAAAMDVAATATADGVIWVRDLVTGVDLERFTTGSPAALSVAFAPDNRTVVSGEAAPDVVDPEQTPATAHVWTTSLVRNVVAESGAVHDVALINAGAQAVTAGATGVQHWNLADGTLLRKFNAEVREYLTVAARGDNQQVVAGDAENRLWFWNAANGESSSMVELAAPAKRVRYSADNQKIVAVCSDNHLRFFDPADGKLTYELSSDKPLAGVAFAMDNRTVLTGGVDLRQWLYASPTAIRTLSGHGGSVYSATFSVDGRWIASTSADQTVRIWDAAAGTQSKQLSGHQGAVYSSSFSPDGALLVSCGADKSVRLWDTLGGRQLKQIPVAEDSLYTVAFFPDGKRVATAGLDRKVYIVDAITGKTENKLDKHPDYLYRVTFNASGSRLLTCGYGGNIVVWNAANTQALYEESLQQVTNFAAFSPDGSRIVVAGGDGAARFLDLPANAK